MANSVRFVLLLAGGGGIALLLAGCTEPTPPSESEPAKAAAAEPTTLPPEADDEHGHKPSAHGGIVVSIGSDSYHAEAVFEKGGVLRLYTLGQDEAVVLEVDRQSLTGYVKVEGGLESEAFTLVPEPQEGDRPGKTSLFVGQLPADVVGKKVEVTIPSLHIGSERFRIAFKSAPDVGDHAMPTKVADAEEIKLYLTPGGKYTEADIKANGEVVASVKFAGVKAEHDLHPKPGDKICPVTLTKANPKFSWVVGGQVYEFCCPPCVDEFVSQAKETPDAVQPPEFYSQQ